LIWLPVVGIENIGDVGEERIKLIKDDLKMMIAPSMCL
jgi:hypothetical protein